MKNKVTIGVFVLFVLIFGWHQIQASKAAREAEFCVQLESNIPGLLQLYFDSGNEFNEKESVQVPYVGGQKKQILNIRLPIGHYKSFRLDPVLNPIQNGAAEIRISKIWLVKHGGDSVTDYDLKQAKPINRFEQYIVEPDGAISFKANAIVNRPIILLPGFALDVASSVTLSSVLWKVIQAFVFAALGAGLVAWMLSVKGANLISKLDSIFGASTLFLLAVIVFFIRNPDPMLNSGIFTEDGLWTGMLLDKGFWTSLWYARSDYFVFGNLVLLQIAVWLNKLAFGYDLSMYPRIVAFVSYMFFAGAAVTIWYGMKGYISEFSRLLLYIAIVLLTLGNSANEVLGRASNIGFILPVILVAILAIREKSVGLKRVVADSSMILLSITNPICIGMWFVYVAWKVWTARKAKGVIAAMSGIGNSGLFSTLILLLIIALIAGRYIWRGNPSDLGRDTLIISHLVEAVVARPILFPWVATVYNHMSDGMALLGIVIFVGVFVAGYYSREKNDATGRMFGVAIFATLIMYSIAVIVLRPGLTAWIGDYRGIYPERYFMGQYLLSVLLMIWALDGIVRRWTQQFSVAVIALVLLVALPIIDSWFSAFEFYEPRAVFVTNATFKESVTVEYMKNPSSSMYRIPTYPKDWFIDLSAPYARATALSEGGLK
ncbi:hypothetical protein [Sideroxydans sp. CL21]|uniref:hypothetical protein n=1 Tax=Sideroxydans sp. CL21 TaxID=2600596 RepID=UPI0024BC17E6|nr:hypothetical protein [Sideroxydans sp. CL21]